MTSLGRARTPAQALFRRVLAINAAVFAVGAILLALGPATVSSPVLLTEFIVLAIGFVVILTANAIFLRKSLAPLETLTQLMTRVDLVTKRDRLDDRGNGDLTTVIDTFNSMLDRLEQERTRASTTALEAQERERQRIARELHDEIGQSLTVALLFLKRSVDHAPADASDELHKAQDAVRSAADEVRQIARRLRPDVLADLGLQSAMSALITEFSQASGVAVTRHLERNLPRLRPAVELVCYRIAQESLTNVARHARAQHVDVALSARDGELTLRISDDGTGEVVGDGAGVTGMRERALLVSGELTISSIPGTGTTVLLRIPEAAT